MSARVEGQQRTVQGIGTENTELRLNEIEREVL